MSKAKILSAAFVAGLATSGAEAAVTSDDDLIAIAPSPAEDKLITYDFELHGDVKAIPAAVHDDDDSEIRIDYAQTYWGGESKDAVKGVIGPGKKQKPSEGITLDNGIKKQGKVKLQQSGTKKKKKKKN